MPFIGNDPYSDTYSRDQVDSKVQLQDEITELSDVVITTPADGEVLVTSGGNVINNTLTEAGIEPADATILKDADIGGTVLGDIVQDTTPQLGGDLDANSNTFNTSSYRQIADISPTTATTHNLNYSSGDYQKVTCPAAGTLTIGYTNFVAGNACAFILELVNGGNCTVSWGAAVKFATGTVPTLTSSGTDVFTIMKDLSNVYTIYQTALDTKVPV